MAETQEATVVKQEVKQPKQTGELKIIPSAQPDPMTLLQIAISNNVDMEKLQKLMEMQERWQAAIAKRNYLEAISLFQSEVPEIKKTKKVSYPSSKGGNVNYSYAPLGEIDKQIKNVMLKHGLSKKWEIKQDSGKIIVTCIISHKDGHSERTTMEGVPDESGNKSGIHQSSSTVSYLQRYTLIGAVGLTTADQDVDGRDKKVAEPIASTTTTFPEETVTIGATKTDRPLEMNQKQFVETKKKVEAGEVTIKKVQEHFTLSEAQLKELQAIKVVKKITEKEFQKAILNVSQGKTTVAQLQIDFELNEDQLNALKAVEPSA